VIEATEPDCPDGTLPPMSLTEFAERIISPRQTALIWDFATKRYVPIVRQSCPLLFTPKRIPIGGFVA
jgi:hypothetical protein